LLAAGGLFYLSRIAGVDTSYGLIVIGMVITSLGIGTTMSPATNSVMGSIPVDEAGVGSAMNDTTRQIGGALGVAVLGTLLNSEYIKHINSASWPAVIPAQAMEIIRGSIQGAHEVASKTPVPQVSQAIVAQSNQAFTTGMSYALTAAAIIMVVTAVIAFLILPARVRPYTPPETREQRKP
jgi:hypothetical protein